VNWEAFFSGLTLLLYAVSSVHYHTHLFAGSERAARIAWVAALVGVGTHTVMLGIWCTTHDWSILRDERMPFSVVAFLIAFVQVAANFRKGWASLGSLSIPLAFIAQTYAAAGNPQSGSTSPGSSLLKPHVLVLLIGFAAFALAFCLAVLYLLQSRLLKTKKIKGLFSRLPPLDSLGSAAHVLAILGFSLLTLGMIAGALVAPEGWSPHWYLDPHIATGLIAWVIYAAYLGASTVLGWRGRRTTYFLIAGFLVVLIAFVTSVNRPKPARSSDNGQRPQIALAPRDPGLTQNGLP
jgi:ABC-type uncharacterized transport system permease subunit